jgi:hypothetical protein
VPASLSPRVATRDDPERAELGHPERPAPPASAANGSSFAPRRWAVARLDQTGRRLIADKLQGKRIAFLATDGVEQVELTEPWKAVGSRRQPGADLARPWTLVEAGVVGGRTLT